MSKLRDELQDYDPPAGGGGALPDNNALSRIQYGTGATMKAFPNDRTGRESAHRSGMWLRAVLLGDEKARRWISESGAYSDIDTTIRMAHSAGVNTSGGVLVPEE